MRLVHLLSIFHLIHTNDLIAGTGSGGQRVQGIVGNLSVFNQVLDEDGLPTPWRQVVTLPAKSLDVPFLGWPDFRAWIARVIVALAAVREDVHLPPRLGDIAFRCFPLQADHKKDSM